MNSIRIARFEIGWPYDGEHTLLFEPTGGASSYRLHCMPSHLIASSPARCRVVRPPGNLDRGQSFTIWLILSVLQHHNYKMGLVSCANEQDLQHIVPDRFWNGLSLPTDVEVSWTQEEEQWDHRSRIGWSHLYPAIHHTIHQELTTLPEEHPTILDRATGGAYKLLRCTEAKIHYISFPVASA